MRNNAIEDHKALNMTKKITVLIGIVFVSVAGVRPAHADAINIIYTMQACADAAAMSGDISNTDHQCTTFPTGVGAGALSPSSAGSGGADITTYSLGPSAFRALLSTEATALSNTLMPNEQATGQGRAFFNLSFDLLLPHIYEFVADVTLSGVNDTPIGSVVFTGPGISFNTVGGPTAGIGILAPGSYLLRASAQSNALTGTGGAAASNALATALFDLHMGAIPVTAVPEPTSMMLLGTGLIGLATRKLRKR